MKEIELKNLRKRREKHFLQENGIIRATLYDDDIHFKKNGQYEEIDNTLIKENDYYKNKANEYQTFFSNSRQTDEFMKMISGDNYLDIRLINCNHVLPQTNKDRIKYENVINGVDIEYQLLPTKVKENIIIKNKESAINELIFKVKTNLDLIVEGNHINAIKGTDIIFTLEVPYMIDTNNNYCDNVYYQLINENGNYTLKLVLNQEWLYSANYPVTIDPTITNRGQNNSVYDTYIYSGDTNADRNSQDILKVGVEEIDGKEVVNRTLIKFELPTIGTGSQIIEATLNLIGYGLDYADYIKQEYQTELINIHQIIQTWDEKSANWNTMNDKFNSRIEATFNSYRSKTIQTDVYETTLYANICSADITSLVKKWYSDTPNNGIMLKANKEQKRSQFVPAFYSKNNQFKSNSPKPFLTIDYRNQNGIESYMDYESQNFIAGNCYINTYNGNLVGVFNLAKTIGGNLPADLNIVYNTNDVILANSIISKNNTNIGVGFMFNYYQTITPVTIESTNYLEYLDEDKTLHYFYPNSMIDEDGNMVQNGTDYVDEDGLNFKIEIKEDHYTLIDKYGNKKIFAIKNGVGYLNKIIDTDNNTITIEYNTDNLINRINDSNNLDINIVYDGNAISITGQNENTKVNFNNNYVSSINTKQGTISFTYNSNNLIETITDVNGKKIKYEYYEQIPYRLKKISEYGLNDSAGNYYTISYGYNTTTIVDNKNIVITKTFNNSGTLTSTSNLKSEDSLTDAYGMYEEYGEEYLFEYVETNPAKNKLLARRIPVKYINNYLNNSSFEDDEICFELEGDAEVSLSYEDPKTGQRCLKSKVSGLWNFGSLSQEVKVPKGSYYTFSIYVRGIPTPFIQLKYETKDGFEIASKKCEPEWDEWTREDITIFYSETATSDLKIIISFDEEGTYYFDDMQLEKGKVANNYNMLENSDFINELSDWELEAYENDDDVELNSEDIFQVVKVDEDTKALKIKMNPTYQTSISKTFSVHGQQGDTYNLSFWYKNGGFFASGLIGDPVENNVNIQFNYLNSDEWGMGTLQLPAFNTNDNEWQYYSVSVPALFDFDSFKVNFYQSNNANDMYIANMCLIKDVREVNYEYDEFGNVIAQSGYGNEVFNYNYDSNNQLIMMTDPKGTNFRYEYDNKVPSKVLCGISDSDISNEVKYDYHGSPFLSRIISKSKVEINDGLYRIRLKGTDKYLRCIDNKIVALDDDYAHDVWNIEKVEDFYCFKHSIINKYISFSNGIILSNNLNNYSLFDLYKNDNGSYSIALKGNALGTDEPTEDVKYINFDDDYNLNLNEIIYDDYHYEFYLETIDNKEFIETRVEYTDDSRFVKRATDPLLNKVEYEVDNETGLINKIIDSNGNITLNTYDDKDRLISIKFADRLINFAYNNANLLSKISNDSVSYNIIYDDFFNVKEVTIGNNIKLITNTFEKNNGNLLSSLYGNNHEKKYSYDNYNRIESIIKMDDTYNYIYDNNGNLAKIESDKGVIKYTYDMSKKLNRYSFNKFNFKYVFDENGNIIQKIHNYDKQFNYNQNITDNIYDKNNNLVETIFNNNSIKYDYDNLGRLIGSKINLYNDLTINNVKYEYLSYGKRTSNVIKSITNNDGKLYYKYDNLYNIREIYHNSVLKNKYYYDDYNELLMEENLCTNQKIKYSYDTNGNILSKTITNLSNNSIISTNTYEYNNLNWKDQLTKFNDEIITYDKIGNPIIIGDNNLEWINGRELKKYNDNIYTYDSLGLRISKIVNGIKTNFFYEENLLIFEVRDGNVIYYIHNSVDDLIGFKYNDNTYFYVKNIQGDVISIVDSDSNIVARYNYDSWGNILSIVDAEDNIIIDTNHIAHKNPYRYRSYYYDEETGLYYLNSRYYNPLWGRFLNADGIIGANRDILSYNLYAYCSNNPIINVDYNGTNIFTDITKKTKDIVNNIFSQFIKSVDKLTANSSNSNNKCTSSTKTASSGHNNLPTRGKPNSTSTKPNGDKRTYGPDGKASTDTDYSHPEHHPELPVPHAHNWTWNGDVPTRGPAYAPSQSSDTAENIAKGVTAGAILYILYRGIRMLPSLTPMTWYTIPVNVAMP